MKRVYNEIDSVTRKVSDVVDSTDKLIEPVRQSLFRRFPILATLLIAFGVSATFFGIERIIMEIVWLNDRPWLIFVAGITALIISGKIYQKLG